MGLDVVYGESRDRLRANRLAEVLTRASDQGTVYLGYPVLATADERVHVDALLVSKDHGLVAFDIADTVTGKGAWATMIADQDRLYGVLSSHLGRHDGLRRGRALAVPIETVTVFASSVQPPPEVKEGHYCGLEDVEALVGSFPALDDKTYRALQAALQRVSTIKPPKRRTRVTKSKSRGAVLKRIERGIANLDAWQQQAAIETPEGPQRIRGLAGSGKTIVLALKAAYLHALQPDWEIAVVFYTRSLHQQFDDLITRFSFEHSNDRPDFDRLRILHAWGASSRDGVYNSIAQHMGAPARDFRFAMEKYGRADAFAGVCGELLDIASQSDDQPMFDAVLIDEAQDLPLEFFKLIFRFTKDPKRIIFAFDELQNLSEFAMPATDELFGAGENGAGPVSLENVEGEARRDIILPVCYRNPPWTLATAHALGFGVYREGGLVQHFDNVKLWLDVGYVTTRGELRPGHSVELERSRASYPDYFEELVDPNDAIAFRVFDSEVEQDSWVAQQIRRNIEFDELEHEDILVVLPEARTAKRRASRFGLVLNRLGIESHLAGVGSSVDEVFLPGSVAMAHIYRAKGNEAPMVYVLDSQVAAGTFNAVSKRNTLFTAITRSRAWTRVCGWGEEMSMIGREIEAVQKHAFRLGFTIPTADELESLRRIHRERSRAEVETLERATKSLNEMFEALERGEIELRDFPPHLRSRLTELLRADLTNGNDS